MIRLTAKDAKRLGVVGKPRRQDREARVFDTACCRWFPLSIDEPFDGRELTLPYPPSVNTYWRNYRGHVTISLDGKAYRAAVCRVLAGCPPLGMDRLRVTVKLYPPDRRTRDLDNAGKAIFDSLKHAGVYVDDEQIDDLRFLRREVRKPGIVMVTLETIN